MTYRKLRQNAREKVLEELAFFREDITNLKLRGYDAHNEKLDMHEQIITKLEGTDSQGRAEFKNSASYKIKKDAITSKLHRINHLNALIDGLNTTYRPSTPNGEQVCDICEAKSMALLVPNYHDSDENQYKCQICGKTSLSSPGIDRLF